MMTVTVLSLAIAAVTTALAVRLLRRERQRSDARVEALAQLADAHPYTGAYTYDDEVAVPDDVPLQRESLDGAAAGVHDMFALRSDVSPWPRRALAVGGVATVVLVFAGLLSAVGRSTPSAEPTEAVAKSAPAPLELLSLRDERSADALVVTGSIRNPQVGATAAGVVATVFALGPDGAFLNSGRAPIDTTALQPGAESRFAVKVPLNGTPARYRVSFRAEDGRVLAHVDKRQPQSLSRR